MAPGCELSAYYIGNMHAIMTLQRAVPCIFRRLLAQVLLFHADELPLSRQGFDCLMCDGMFQASSDARLADSIRILRECVGTPLAATSRFDDCAHVCLIFSFLM
jgi:hypothetical protein